MRRWPSRRGSTTGSGEPGPGEERTVRLVRKRFARRQRARRWSVWRWVLAGALLAGSAAAVVWLVFFSSVLSVADVSVHGNSLVSTESVRRAADVPTGEPLATADLAGVARRVEALPAVHSADVSRAWPDRIRIDVSERHAVAVAERDGVLEGLDASGVLFRSYPSPPSGLPLVRVGPDVKAEAIVEAAKVVTSLPGRLSRRVASVDVATIDAIELRLHDERRIFWGSAEQSDNKAAVLEVLLRTAPDVSVYDVSVPGQPTTRA